MGENFIKFKNKAFKIRLFKSVCSGASLGFFVSGTLLLLGKLGLIGLAPLVSCLLGACGAILLGAVLFLLLRTSDEGLARLLDRELELSERVQTMLEYSQETSAIHRLQREDANERLSSASPRFLKIKRLWLFIILPTLGAALLLFSLIYTKPEKPEEPEVLEGFEITELQIKAMNELISSVQSSEMASPYRENTVTVLSDLLDTLKSVETVVDKDAAVNAAMEKILIETDNSSGAVELMAALWASDSAETRQLAKAINYYDWPTLDEWDKYSSAFADFRTVFINPGVAVENPDESKINTETELSLLKASTGISKALLSSGISSEDPLSVQLARLALAEEENGDGTRVYGLAKLSALVSQSGYASVQRELDSTLTAISPALFSALSAHKESTDTGENAVKRLGHIFDCEVLNFERPAFFEISDGTTAPGEDGSGGGAIGSGTEYGSDDLILDPYTGTYVPYGVIIERYYELMFGGLMSGDYTDGQKDAMEKYFAILYGGFDKGEGTDE